MQSTTKPSVTHTPGSLPSLVLALLAFLAAAQPAAPAATVPVLYCTDLFHPHDDPDDHFDLATLYAIEGLDLRRIVLDRGAKQLQRPGKIPVAQLNRLTGRGVPAAIGLAAKLQSPADKALEQPPEFQAGVRLILETLRGSARPVAIAAVGSLRDIAAAYNREPDLFRAKAGKLLIFIGEASDPQHQEYNVKLDPQAYVCLMRSGLPIYWVPCFDGGARQNKGHASFWRARHEDLLKNSAPGLIQYFIYALEKETADPLAFLATPVDPVRKARLFSATRNLWCTAIFSVLADRIVAAEGAKVGYVPLTQAPGKKSSTAAPLFGFSPVTIHVTDDAVVHEGPGPDSRRVLRFEILNQAEYAAGMTAATAQLFLKIGGGR